MKIARLVLAAALLGAALGAAGGDARAEVQAPVPPGHHPVRHEILLDLAEWADRVPWRYVVRAGDTLGEIAERELGTLRRAGEIRGLNPGLRAAALPAGRSLLMPPRTCPTDGARAWCAFFAYADDPRGWSAPRRLDSGEVHRLGDRTRLYAVPCRRLPAVLLQSRDDEIDGDLLDADAGIPRSAPVSMTVALPDTDPTARLVTRYRVGGVRDGRVLLERVAEERFDAEGRAVAAPLRADGAGPSTALLLVAFVGIFGSLAAALHATRPLWTAANAEPEPSPEPEPVA